MARGHKSKSSRCRGSRRSAGSSTGAVTTKKELGIKVTDFFDYDYGAGGTGGACKHYFWDISQNLFNNNQTGLTDPSLETCCRVRRAEVFILPRKGIGGTDVNNAQAMYTVNMQVPGLAGFTRPTGALGTSDILATNTQVTNVLPQVDTMWKKVMTCNYDTTFKSGVVRPYFYNNAQCLFSMRLLDPKDGGNLDGTGSEDVKIRVKVVLHVDQPILPVQTASKILYSNGTMNDPGFPNAPSDPPPKPVVEYVQMDLERVLDKFR